LATEASSGAGESVRQLASEHWEPASHETLQAPQFELSVWSSTQASVVPPVTGHSMPPSQGAPALPPLDVAIPPVEELPEPVPPEELARPVLPLPELLVLPLLEVPVPELPVLALPVVAPPPVPLPPPVEVELLPAPLDAAELTPAVSPEEDPSSAETQAWLTHRKPSGQLPEQLFPA
jgi:hypothetical protein